jgi:hypothetical protein
MKPAFTSGRFARGQMFSFDFMIASSLLLLVVAVLTIQVGYELKETQEASGKGVLMKDADRLSGIFFDEGYPKDWTNETVQAIGLQSNGRISLQKLSYLGQAPYSGIIALAGLSSDYNITITSGSNELFNFGAPYINASSIVKKERFGVLENGTIVVIEVLVFEK